MPGAAPPLEGDYPSVWGLSTKELAGTGMLSAVAALFEVLPFDLPFPLLPFLTFDPTGIPIAIAAILYGPSAGMVATGIAGIVIGARNPVGATFKTVAEFSTVVPLALVMHRFKRSLSRGGTTGWITVTGLTWVAAIGSRVAVMTLFNYAVLPIIIPSMANVIVFILVPIAVFNLIQGVLNVVPAYFVVDRLPPDLKPDWLSHPREQRG